MAMAASTETEHPRTPHRPSNEYVLGVAFYSFIGFVAVQAVFAIIANSQAMLADSEAMSVDAFTYLFNLVAERYKNRPLSDEEHQLSPTLVEYRREMQRLYLELVPPSISVVALVAVTALTLREATSTLRGEEEGDDDNVSISIMLIFSAANLLLDILNVTIFAQAGFNFGLDVVRQEGHSIRESIRDSFQFTATTKEGMRLLQEGQGSASYTEDSEPMDVDRISSSIMTPRKRHHLINLNMCSAWTVRSHWHGPLGCFSISHHCTACLRRYTPQHCRLDCGRDCLGLYLDRWIRGR